MLTLGEIELSSVYTTPEKFENAALFLRQGLPSTLIRHKSEAFFARSSNRRDLITPSLRLCVDGKHFENGTFQKRGCHYDFPDRVFLKQKSKMTGDCCVF